MKMYKSSYNDMYYFIKNNRVMCNDTQEIEGAIISFFSIDDFNHCILDGRFTEVQEAQQENNHNAFVMQLVLIITIAAVAMGVIFL